MKVVILAGGLGTRLGTDTNIKPKPMIELGGKPILWHIMKIYSNYGFNEFIILLGYKGYIIKEFFANYLLHQNDFRVDFQTGNIEFLQNSNEKWKVTLFDTGINSMTGGRIKRAQDLLKDNTFMLTYGDGVGNINISELIKFHQSHGKALTMTSTKPEGRFGSINVDHRNKVNNFAEKIDDDGNWINAGFFVCEPKIFEYITSGDKTIFEQEPLFNLVRDDEVYTYQHNGFWSPMDTPRDKIKLQNMCDSGEAPWITWDN